MGRLELLEAQEARTVIGAPLPVDIGLGGRDYVRQFGARLEKDATKLEADARAQIVFVDPSDLAEIAKDYGDGVPAAVAVLTARAEARGPAQTQKDLAWAGPFNEWIVVLRAYNAKIQSFDLTGPDVGEAWSQLQTFDKQFRAQYDAFTKLGGTKVSFVPPATYETATGQPEKESGVLTAIKWAAGAVALLAIAKAVRG